MKYDNDAIKALKDIAKNLIEIFLIEFGPRKRDTFEYTKPFQINTSTDNDFCATNININKDYIESVKSNDNNEFFYNNKDVNCYDKQQNTSSYSKGVMDLVAEDLTPVRLQQAIILSEIVGKPRSKTRKRRRF